MMIIKTKVLFVCMGNSCRSPAAEGVLRSMIKAAGLEHLIDVDSAGTTAFHAGELPDPRSIQIAKKRGYDLTAITSRQIVTEDFLNYDYILCMDWENQTQLRAQAPKAVKHKIELMMRYANDSEEATVPDPYYAGPESFAKMMDLVEDACEGFMEVLKKRTAMYTQKS